MSDSDVPSRVATKILLVDDDVQLVRGLKTALEHYGHVVQAVERGGQALETAIRFRPDLVILDVMMPGVDGWEVLSRLRGNPAMETVPVIMLTASSAESAKVKGFSLGADDYVTKPFSLQELHLRVDAVLRRTRPHESPQAECCVPVLEGTSRYQLLNGGDIYFAQGMRNYTYVHTYDSRYLSRLSLGALNDRRVEDFMRVHRSFIVNMTHVRGCGWVSHSSYRLRLGDLARTEIPVSRTLVSEVQRRLGIKE